MGQHYVGRREPDRAPSFVSVGDLSVNGERVAQE